MEKIRIEQHSSIGLLWVAGWLFTIGYLELAFWQGLLAIARSGPTTSALHFAAVPA